MTVNMKPIQDIMRKDVGVDGDAQRISQLVWMIFLKVIDDLEKEFEILESYNSPIPEKLRWRNWAENEEGITGDELVEFINNELFPGLKDLSIETTNSFLALKIRTVFEDAYNYMKSGTLIRQIINKVNEINFNNSQDRHLFNDIYEGMLKELQSAGNAGEFYTPRAVTNFMVKMINPKINEVVLDPAAGTGGFLISVLQHLNEQVKSVEDNELITRNIRGIEKKPLPYLLAITNMLLHRVTAPNIIRGNTLSQKPLKDYGRKDMVDVVVTNPPFGGKEEKGVPSNFPKNFRTSETADLFLVYIMKMLSDKGRAAIVLPDGSLFGKGIKTRIKEKLLSEFNLHTIVRLPKDVFSPYTDIATNLLFFEAGKPTKEIWFYEHQMPEGMKHYSKTKPIRDEEFEPIIEWWKNKQENDFAWKVSIDKIKERDYDLDIQNPNKKIDKIKSPTEIVSTILELKNEMEQSLENLYKELLNFETNKHQLEPLSELLERSTEQVELDPNTTYNQVTVKLWGKGVIKRNEVKGAKIATKKRNVVRENQLIFSKIDARHGAIGIVPDFLDGAVVSGDFPSFILNSEKIIPDYLEIIVKTPEFLQKCQKVSSGTTNRVRLKEKDFLEIKIPVPSVEEQESIVEEVQSYLSLCDEIEHSINRIKDNSDLLKNSLLNGLFNE